MKTFFLVVATIIMIGSVLPYARDTLKGSTKPNIVTWITWTLLNSIATAAEIVAHEYITAIFTGAAAAQAGLVVILGLWHGYVKYARFDIACQVAAVVGIILWQIFNSPVIGVLASVAIDLVGALPTLYHSWLNPGEETWQTYALVGLSGVFAVAALNDYNWISLPYAVYIVAVNVAISAIIVNRSKAKPAVL